MNILLYSPDMEGHPQLYCRVLSDILPEEGHQIVIAGSGGRNDWPLGWALLAPLARNASVHFVETRKYSAQGNASLSAEELLTLQRDLSVDATLLVAGDDFAGELRRIAEGNAPRLRGKVVGIFSRTSGWYPRERDYGGAPVPLVFGGSARASLRRLRDLLMRRRQSQAWFYRSVLLRRRVVDTVVVKDERVAERFSGRVQWMPEIFKVFDPLPEERRAADWDECSGPIQEYVSRAGASRVLLFFGTGAWYKGYDLFLRLADLEPSTFALHAGAPQREEPSKPMAFDTALLRERLRRQGRLFETTRFVDSQDLVDLLFGSIERFVSTHRLTLSSGTILQALDAGKPVLTASTGLVGYQTNRYGLGRTYGYFDDQDLAEQWRRFSKEPPETYAPSIATFMRRFSREAVREFFLAQLCR